MFEPHMIATFLASFLVWIMIAGVLLAWFLRPSITKKVLFRTMLAVFIALIAAVLLKQIIATDRPFENSDLVPLTVTVPGDNSFPSVHTAVAFAMVIPVWKASRKAGILFAVLAVLVATGRILANVHYPQDIIGGAVLGMIVGAAAST